MRPALLALLAAGALAGCSRRELSGPPTLRLGRDECAECGMIVSEDRFSSALLVERDGRREHLVFDDAGCMLDYEHAHAGEFRLVEGFVHDHATRAWTPCGSAWFLLADPDRLPTPMGTGIAAFTGRDGAEAARALHGGEVLDWSGLAAARRAWMEARYGRPREGP